MHETMIRRIPILLAVTMILVTGCEENGNENSRVAKVAVEAAERQAKQNREMARLHRETTAAWLPTVKTIPARRGLWGAFSRCDR